MQSTWKLNGRPTATCLSRHTPPCSVRHALYEQAGRPASSDGAPASALCGAVALHMVLPPPASQAPAQQRRPDLARLLTSCLRLAGLPRTGGAHRGRGSPVRLQQTALCRQRCYSVPASEYWPLANRCDTGLARVDSSTLAQGWLNTEYGSHLVCPAHCDHSVTVPLR
jgi:hypothetical protein